MEGKKIAKMFRFPSHSNTAGPQLGSGGTQTLSSGLCPLCARLCENAIFSAGEQPLIGTGCPDQIFFFSWKKKSRLSVGKDQEELSLRSGQVPVLGIPEACADRTWAAVGEHWIGTVQKPVMGHP